MQDQHMVSIYRNWGQKDEIHMTVYLEDKDYKRLQEIAVTEKLTATQAYDKMESEKSEIKDQ